MIPGLGSRLAGTRDVLANQNLARLLFAWGVWVTTDWALLITVSLLALELSGPAAVGLVGALRVLPAAVLTGPMSVLTDRWSRGRLMAIVYAGWAVLAGLLAWAALVRAPLTLLLAIIAVGSALAAVLKPTLQAMIPTLVSMPRELITANSAYATLEALGTVLGPGLCAALLVGLGPSGVFVILAVLFAVAAVASLSIATPFQPARQNPATGLKAWLAPLRGFGVLAGRGTRMMVLLFFAQTTTRGLLNVFVVLVATSVAGGGEALAGSLFAAIGVGGLLGAALGAALGGSRRGSRWIAVGICLWGLPLVVIGLTLDRTAALIALAVLGLGNAVLDTFGYSMLNRLFPDHLAGRAWGAFHSGSAATVALGSLAAPLLVALFGLPGAMIAVGVLMAVAPWLAWPWLRRLDAHASGRPEDVDLLRRVPLFAPMSMIGLERLARAAESVNVAATETVVREGERSDGFYVIADGGLSVWQQGRAVRDLGPAEAFGEIALLDPGPRTATVVAEQPSRLLRLDSDAFVAAVTGHRPTDDLARGTVADYLTADELRREGS